ncbi:hypothetical protein ACFPU1_11345 [Thalassorhabdus alkalitolerans]|uniref:DUF2802 domain-containing protein n=1 Tax=Thalassorhabdus alkalitolerans TaxID=2282697 RepID=A0ABW0YPV3_9BACI|nr:hypothetical protein [Thalassobacillus sp. C254]
MEWMIIILLSIGLGLFILSFCGKDTIKETEKQIEDLSITHLTELYKLKKKVKVLEEELLSSSANPVFSKGSTGTAKLKEEASQFVNEGLDVQDIAQKMRLTEEEVQRLL